MIQQFVLCYFFVNVKMHLCLFTVLRMFKNLVMYKKLPHYDNVFINTEDWKLYMLQDNRMVEIDDGQAIFYTVRYGQDTENRKALLD